MSKHSIYFGHDIFAINHDWPVRAVTKGDVQNSTIFSGVNFFAIEHLLGYAMNIGFFCEFKKKGHGFFGNTIFRVVEKDGLELKVKLIEASRISSK